MRSLPALLLAVAPAVIHLACSGGETHGTTSSGSGGGAAACPPCVTDNDCASGSRCGQFGGDTYCAPDCSSAACAAGRACTPLNSAEGQPVALCVPESDVCGGASSSGSGGGAASSSSSSSSSTSASSSSSGGTGGMVGPTGGTVDALRFAIVGDTRPAMIDDTAGYPTTVIQKIWQDVEGHAPRPYFAVTTGDYMFAKSFGSQAGPQLDKYLAARAAFGNVVFPAMGNHECTGATASNCGQGNADGVTTNYTTFLQKMLAPIGQDKPYYTVVVNGTGNAWTAKFVFVAANAWDATQASWLASELGKPTTYTFVVRHEGTSATTAPGVTPSAQIMAQHPYTLLLAGHTHTFAYYKSSKEVITGNGGAPLTGAINYGYVIAEQRADGAIVFSEYDYSTNTVQKTFAVKADGSAAP